ncbi:hypothetical protein VKT23_006559 [Stygiomarasmius scandens]
MRLSKKDILTDFYDNLKALPGLSLSSEHFLRQRTAKDVTIRALKTPLSLNPSADEIAAAANDAEQNIDIFGYFWDAVAPYNDHNATPEIVHFLVTVAPLKNRKSRAKKSGGGHLSVSSLLSVPEAVDAYTHVFYSDVVSAMVNTQGCHVKLPDNRPHLAYICDGEESVVGYLKVLSPNEKDVIALLQDKADIALFCLPHRILDICGHCLGVFNADGLSLDQSELEGHQVDAAIQLLRAISILHSLHIAHLDLKPDNLLWCSATSSLKVMDFSVSLIRPDHTSVIKGFVGTVGFVAPEVGKQPFNPFVADAWACGLNMWSMVEHAPRSKLQVFVRDLAIQMMKNRQITVEDALGMLDTFVAAKNSYE